MTESFFNPDNLNSAQYTRHHVYEVAKSNTDAKYIANDLANAKRYAYRAKVTLLGNASVRPYDPIYLDGLPNGMSGYWTVLSVKHRFNSADVEYKMELEVGTDKLGDTNPDAANAVQYRDVEAELAGQSLEPAESRLIEVSSSVNASSLLPDYGNTLPSPITTPAANAVPATIEDNPYAYDSPTPKKDITSSRYVAI